MHGGTHGSRKAGAKKIIKLARFPRGPSDFSQQQCNAEPCRCRTEIITRGAFVRRDLDPSECLSSLTIDGHTNDASILIRIVKMTSHVAALRRPITLLDSVPPHRPWFE